jgi:putative endopeptidase
MKELIAGLLLSWISDPLYQMYVAKQSPPEAKQAANDMVQYIVTAFKEAIEAVPWMKEMTKANALKKLSSVKVSIGFVCLLLTTARQMERFRSFTGANLSQSSLRFKHPFNREYSYKLTDLDRLNKPVDPNRWYIAPFIVNAYYNAAANQIVFPAAILQPPYFFAPTTDNSNGEPALSFGAIGSVIAHELSHGFDDSGRQYDSKGEITDWWTERDSNEFNSRAKRIIDLFSSFSFVGEKVNGNLTKSEKLGGVAISYAAFEAWLANHPEYIPTPGYFNAEQRFFIAYAQQYASMIRDEAAKQHLSADVHNVRRNVGEFHAQFGVKQGDAMYLAVSERVKIW